MRLFILALVSLLAALALTAATSSKVAVAAPPVASTPAIVDSHVQAGDTWTDPDTNVTYRSYTFTLDFTHHRGFIGFQTNAYLVGSTEKFAWDSTVIKERTIGADSLSIQLGVDVTQTVYFKLFLFKPELSTGPPSQRAEVVYGSRTTSTYSG